MPIRTILSIGQQLAGVPESAHRIRRVCLFTSAFLVTLVALAVSAAPAVISAHEEKLDQRTLKVKEQSASPTGLWATDFGPVEQRRWNGQEISTMHVASSAPNPMAAARLGITQLPKPDEVYISPALQNDLQNSPLIRELLQGSRISGLITNAGLTAPQERRIIFGVKKNESWLQPVSGIGGERDGLFKDLDVLYGSLGFISLIITIPAALIAIIAARLSYDRRRQRVQSLRILGIGESTIRLLLSVETLLAVVPGVIAAVVILTILRGPGSDLVESNLPVFSADIPGGAVQFLLVPALVTLLFVSFSLVGNRVGSRSVRTVQTVGSPHLWPLVIFFIALVSYPVYIYFFSASPELATSSFWISTLATAPLLATSSRDIISPFSRICIQLSAKGGWFYGFRLAQFRSGLCQRIAGALALVTAFTAAALLFIGALGGYREQPVINADLPANISIDLSAGEVATLSNKDWLEGATQLPRFTLETDGRDSVRAIQASCEEISTIIIDACPAEPAWLAKKTGNARMDSFTSPNQGKTKVLKLPQGSLKAPASTESLSYRPAAAETANIFIPESATVNLGKPNGLTILVSQQDTDLVLAQLAAAYPDRFPIVGNFANPSVLPFQGFIAAYVFAISGSLILGAMALTLGALGDIWARRRALLGLLMLGTGRADAVRAHVASVTVPLITLGGLAVGTAAVNYQSFHKVDPDVQLPSGVHLALAVGTFSAALAVTLITLPAALKPLQPDELRSL